MTSVDLKMPKICEFVNDVDRLFLIQLFPTAVTMETTTAPPRNLNWTVAAVPTAALILLSLKHFLGWICGRIGLTEVSFL